MTAEESACNGAGEARQVELEGKEEVAVASPPEPEKNGGIACSEVEDNDGGGIGGPFVIVNGDADDLSEKGSDLDAKTDRSAGDAVEVTTGKEKEAPEVNAGPVVEEEVVVVGRDHDASSGDKGKDSTAEVCAGANRHDHVERSADSVVEEEAEVHVKESRDGRVAVVAELEKRTENNNEEGGECEELGRAMDLACSDHQAASGGDEGKEGEAEVCMANGHDHVERSDDPVAKQETPIEETKDEEVATIAEMKERIEKNNDEGVQDEESATKKEQGEGEELDVGKQGEVIPESDPSAKLGGEQKAEIEVVMVAVECTLHNAVKAKSEVELESADIDEAQQLKTVVEEVNQKGDQPNSTAVQQETAHAPSDADGQAETSRDTSEAGRENQVGSESASDLELKQENEPVAKETAVDTQLQPAAEMFTETMPARPLLVMQDELRSLDLVDGGRVAKHSDECVSTPEFEAQDHMQVGQDCDSPDDHESKCTVVGDKTEVNDNNLEFAKEDLVNDTAMESESADHLQDQHSENVVNNGTSGSLETGTEAPSAIDEPCPSDRAVQYGTESPCPVDEPCPSDISQKEICAENINASIDASAEIETKCVGGLEPISAHTSNVFAHEIEVHGSKGDNGKDDDTSSVAADSEAMCADGSGQVDDCTGDNAESGPSIEEDDGRTVDIIERDEHTVVKDDDDQQAMEDPSGPNVELDKGEGEVQLKRNKIFIIKVPRFSDDDLWARILNAQSQLDEKQHSVDSIQASVRKQKGVCGGYREKLEATRADERAARTSHNNMKKDLSVVQSMIGKLNKANSIEEIDEMIEAKEKYMQHETTTVKQEKLLIQEIKELKAQRKQLYSNMGSKAEIDEAFDQREQIHERHKALKKDSGAILNNLKHLEEKRKEAQKNYDDEQEVLRKLQEQHNAAREIRQKAYNHWYHLKKEFQKKGNHFFMYKEDKKVVGDYLSSGDMEGLQFFCNKQIERVFEIWNKNEGFRKQYVELNKASTLRRLGTLDGRRLGPNENPLVIPTNVNRRASNSSPLPASKPHASVVASEAGIEKSAPPTAPPKEDSFPALQAPQSSKRAKSKASGNNPDQIEMAVAPLSEKEDVDRVEKDKARRMEGELEVARKAEELARREEELRKEKAAAEKEQLRLEQKEKAKEAEERKKRKVEKAQERAEYKARKEAEIREKKKAKKHKKKGLESADAANGSGESNDTATAATDTGSSSSSSTAEISRAVDVPPPTASKRPSRPAVAVKQLNRVQPIPLPLRNRGKRRMRSWMLAALAVILVLALFLAGNYVSFSSFSRSQVQN